MAKRRTKAKRGKPAARRKSARRRKQPDYNPMDAFIALIVLVAAGIGIYIISVTKW